MLDVAVLIPALDEEAALPRVLAAIPRGGPGWRLSEVVVADNGSRDGTAVVARAGGATVIHERRRGYGAACLAGLAHLRSRPPAAIAFIDADGSSNPAELGALVEPIVHGTSDLVVGSRRLGLCEPGSLTPVQAFGNALATRLIRLAWGVRFTDLGPFRAIGWDALESLGMRDRDFGWTVEMQARAARAGLRCAEVPASNARRRGGRSKVAGTLRGSTAAGAKILITLARVRVGF